MKKTILLMLLIGVLLLNACGSDENETLETSAPPASNTSQTTLLADLTENEIYDEFLSRLCKKLSNIIVDDTHLDGFNTQEGMVGVAEIASLRELDLLDKIGYKIIDINEDGILELLISCVDISNDGFGNGQRILCAYTVSENEAVLLFQGDSQNCYYLLNDASVYNNRNNASLLSAGVYQLGEGCTELSCVDFYFTTLDNNNHLLYYHNQTGAEDISTSDLIEEGADGFGDINEWLSSRIQSIELTLLSSLDR